MKQLVLGFAMLTACQAGTTTSTIEQPLEDVCNVEGPPAMEWKGTLPPVTATTQIVILRNDNQWAAYAADPADMKIHWVFALDSKSLGSFLVSLPPTDRDYISIRVPPTQQCPPLCGDWPARYAMAAAVRAEPIAVDSQIDVEACSQ